MSSLTERSLSAEKSPLCAVSLRARLVSLFVLWAIQLLYVPINRLVQGGVILDTPWDAYFTLQTIWVIPYLLSLVWWVGCYMWAAFKMEDGLFRAFITSFVAVMLASYVVYIFYPTYVVRPTVSGEDWLSQLVSHLYTHDHVNNAFPSGHTYNTALIALYWSRWHPRHWWLWWTITAIVLLSTLFTRQHNLPDLVGGLAFAWVGYRFGLWWAMHHAQET